MYGKYGNIRIIALKILSRPEYKMILYDYSIIITMLWTRTWNRKIIIFYVRIMQFFSNNGFRKSALGNLGHICKKAHMIKENMPT